MGFAFVISSLALFWWAIQGQDREAKNEIGPAIGGTYLLLAGYSLVFIVGKLLWKMSTMLG